VRKFLHQEGHLFSFVHKLRFLCKAIGQKIIGKHVLGGADTIRLGVDQDHAYAWSRTRKGGWAVAQSPILTTTITLSRLRRKGYESMLSYYQKSQPTIQ